MNLVETKPSIGGMSVESIDNVRQLEQKMLDMPQVEIRTDHHLENGLYARTIMVPAGCVLTGAEIIIETMLIISGNVTVAVDSGSFELVGYHVIKAEAGRKQAFIAHENTYITMVFPTGAKTVEEAENEFTNEPHMLGSRREKA